MPSVRQILAAAVLAALAPLCAQGTPSPTLLRPSPDEAASPARRAGPAGLVAKARASVVHIVVEVEGPRGAFPIVRSSSGVIVHADGLVLTWRHLVREADGADDKRIYVQLDDAQNTRLPAVVEATDAATGFVLLRVKPSASLQAAKLVGSPAQPGSPALVLSRPEGKEMLAFAGVTSAAACGVSIGGAQFAREAILLCDSRNDERCDGAPVFDADGAKKLWSTVAKKTGVATEAEAPAEPAAAHDLPAAELLALLRVQLARQEQRLSELHQQMVSSTALIQTLAEQNAQLVQRVEANRVRVRWLTVAVLVLALGLAALWAMGR